MEKRILSVSLKMKGAFDDDYTLYDDGSVLHFYDRNQFNLNISDNLTIKDLSDEIKIRLYEAAEDANKDEVKQILNLNIN